MPEFYLLESDLRVPSQFWEGGYVNIKGISLPFCGEGGIVTRMDLHTNKEWSVERDLWCLAQVASEGEMVVLVLGDMWFEDEPDAYRWRVTPGKVEVSSAARVVWKPWEEEEPDSDARWWGGVLALVRQEPLDVRVVQAFEPTSHRLPENFAVSARWLQRICVKVTNEAFVYLKGLGTEIFRTPEGILAAFDQTGGREEIVLLWITDQRLLEKDRPESW